MYGVTGAHDFLVWQAGLGWTIETKFGYNGPTANQTRFAESIQQSGGLCLCINETNLWQVQMTLDYIHTMRCLPLHYNHDFRSLEKGTRKK